MGNYDYKSNIWKYYSFELFMGLWFTLPISVIFLRSFDISYGQIGLIEFVSAIIVVVLEIPTGAFSDSIGKKISLILAALLWCAAMIAIGFGSTFRMFILGFVLWAISDSLLSGTKSAFVYDSLKRLGKEKSYLRVKGISNFIESFSIIIASLFGAYLFTVNVKLPWIFFAGSAFLASLFMLAAKEPYTNHSKYNVTNQIKLMKQSISFVASHSTIRWIVIYASTIILPFTIFNNLVKQPYILDMGFQVVSLGWITAIMYGVGGLFSVFSKEIEKRVGEKGSFFLVTFVHGLGFMLLGLFRFEPMLIIVILIYMSRFYKDNILEYYINNHVGSKNRTTVLSINNLVVSLLSSFYVLIGGRLLDIFPMQAVLFASGIIVVILCLPIVITRFYLKKTLVSTGK
ncbi:MAG: MFS transporter [Nanoarchaeota archaeon]